MAAALTLVLVAPFFVSAGRAFVGGWEPSGDEAIMAIRMHDVLTSNPPLTGLPSTSDLYGDKISTRHPGPFEFYVLAGPVRLFGPRAGMLFGTAAVNASAVLLALWVVFRRAGPRVALGSSVLFALMIWSTGTAVLSDPISSNAGGYPMLATALLAWALACGDHRLLPVTALVASYAAQQHLGVTMAVVLVSAWGLLGLALYAWAHRTSGPRGAPGESSDDAIPRGGKRWPWLLVAGAVGVLVWAPVLIDQATGDPGNITAVLQFAGDDGRPTLGAGTAARTVLRVAGLPPFLFRHDLTGDDLRAPLSAFGMATGAVVLAALGAIAVTGWRRSPDRSRLATTALVMAGAGFVSVANLPDSFEAGRINLYRWSWVLAVTAWLAIGWVVLPVVWRWVSAKARPAASAGARVGPFADVLVVLVVTALVAGSLATSGPDDRRRDAMVFDVERALAPGAVRAARPLDPVMLVPDGAMARLSVAPAIAAELVDAGITIQVPSYRLDAFGEEREFNPDTVGGGVVVISSFGTLPEVEGTFIGEEVLDPAIAPVTARLASAARSGPPVRSDESERIRATVSPQLALLIDLRMDRLHIDPAGAFTSPEVVQWLLDGYLDFPRFARADLLAWQANLPDLKLVWGDDRVAAYVLDRDQLQAYRPNLFR